LKIIFYQNINPIKLIKNMKSIKIIYYRLIFILTIFTMLGFNTGVKAQPNLEIVPQEYDYGSVIVGSFKDHYFTFSNTGTDTLYITDITFTNAAFSIQYTHFSIAPGGSGQLPIRFKPTEALVYSSKMQITSNDPDENPYTVALFGEGTVATVDGWEWINTGFDYILVDIAFPQGQNKIGYAVGQKNTYNGEGLVIKTTDGGTKWERVSDSGVVWLNAMSFVDTLVGYAGGLDGYIMKTTNGGETWKKVNFPYADEVYQITSINFKDADHGIVGVNVTYGEDPAIYLTSDGGETWTKSTAYQLYSTFMVEWVNDTVLVAVGMQDQIVRSTDGGLTWTLVYTSGNPNNILTAVTFYNEKYGLATGDYSHVYETKDGGETWNQLEFIPGTDMLLHTAYIWDEDTAWIVGTPELVYKTTDGGATWHNAYNGNYQRAFYRILFTDNYTGYICGSHGAFLRKKGFEEIPVGEVTPQSLNFGEVNVGDVVTKQIVVKNSGYGNLEVTKIVSDNDAYTVDTTYFSVRPRHEMIVNVTFNPLTEGTFDGELSITTNDTLTPVFTVSLSGSAVAYIPDIAVSPDSVDFGTVGTTETATQQITVTNNGNGVLSVTNITSSEAVFTVDETSFDVNPGNTHTFNVIFTPTDEQQYAGTLEIASNDPDESIVTVKLNGEGMVYAPEIIVSPMELDYDTVLVGTVSSKMINVTNNGNSDLVVSSITSSDDAFTAVQTSFTLEPGNSQNVQVNFSTNVVGDYQAVLTIESNDPANSQVEVDLKGYATIETAINEIDEENQAVIYPNPARNILYISNVKDKQIKVFDLSGRMVYYTIARADRISLNVSDYKNGVYLFKVIGNNTVETIKINIKH
jgi:photosystem II stability/assembly factor-like uncharacterized protein